MPAYGDFGTYVRYNVNGPGSNGGDSTAGMHSVDPRAPAYRPPPPGSWNPSSGSSAPVRHPIPDNSEVNALHRMNAERLQNQARREAALVPKRRYAALLKNHTALPPNAFAGFVPSNQAATTGTQILGPKGYESLVFSVDAERRLSVRFMGHSGPVDIDGFFKVTGRSRISRSPNPTTLIEGYLGGDGSLRLTQAAHIKSPTGYKVGPFVADDQPRVQAVSVDLSENRARLELNPAMLNAAFSLRTYRGAVARDGEIHFQIQNPMQKYERSVGAGTGDDAARLQAAVTKAEELIGAGRERIRGLGMKVEKGRAHFARASETEPLVLRVSILDTTGKEHLCGTVVP